MKRLPAPALLVLLLAAPAPGADWRDPLYLDGGGYWRARAPVAVVNDMDRAAEGDPVALRVGGAPGELDIAGAEARALRVCDAQGVEMLFGLTRPDGTEFQAGPVPAGAALLLPAECPPRGKAAYYVYFDNPAAGLVPDFLPARPGLVNGDVEWGEGPAPDAWRHDEPDAQRRAEWSMENPQSGKRCLKTIVAEGAEPTWIATRQTGIRLTPGARYVLKAWVRAEGVRGFAGWYVHVGNRDNPMLLAPMLDAGGGTYAWKEVTAEFTAPDEAHLASVGTVLRGTGTAWFDNVRLECLDPPKLRAFAEKPQRIELREIGAGAPWDAPPPGKPAHTRRAAVRAMNFDPRPLEALVAVDCAALDHRLGGRLDPASLAVFLAGKLTRHSVLNGTLLVEGPLEARTAATYYVYYSARGGRDGDSHKSDASPLAGMGNLLKNPSFEAGDGAIADWQGTPSDKKAGVALGPDASAAPGLGKRSAKMHVPHGAPKAWRGWQQSVAVRPGAAYLVAAHVRCQDLRGGDLRLHLHVHRADGSLSEDNPMRGTASSVQGTAGWTLLSGTFAMPADAASMRLHLTMDATGTAWHDGALVAEVVRGRTAAMEGRPMRPEEPIAVWPVNPLMKVFLDEPAPEGDEEGDSPIFAARKSGQSPARKSGQSPARKSGQSPGVAAVCLARNEYEPLQLAVRSGRVWKGVRVEVDPPIGPDGAKLGPVEINVVGYVAIDYPTNYYQSTAPEWRRKTPSHGPACDGFAGLWPDPLLPRATFDLAPNQTQALWLTFHAPKNAPAGVYRGAVRLVAQEGDSSNLPRSGKLDESPLSVPYEVCVRGFALPDRTRLKAIYDVRFGPGAGHWGKGLDASYRELVQFMARRRLSPDAVRPEPVFKYEGGRVTADFAEFDKAAAWYFGELGLAHSYMPWHFYLFGWGHPPKTVGRERPYPGEHPYDGADRAKLRPEYKRLYQQALRLFWDHVKEKGWQDRFVLYISDEPFYGQPRVVEQMKALCAMIHEVDPAIPVYSSTWHHVPQWDESLDVWGIGHYGVVPVEQIARLRAAGRRVWFTTDGQMCTDTPYCAVERLLPHYCFRYGAEAYEFWGVAWTTYDPYRYGWHAYIHQSDQPGKSYWVRYPNGDGFLIYPGALVGHEGPVSSIRLEQAREGVEDFEYLCLLREAVAKAKAEGPGAAAGEKALARAAALVEIPNAGGRYSTKILPDPDAVLEVRRSVAEAIEGLLGPQVRAPGGPGR